MPSPDSDRLPLTHEIYVRGPWWRTLLKPQYIIIQRGPVFLSDTIIIVDLSRQTCKVLQGWQWVNWKSAEKLKLIGHIKPEGD